MYAGFLRLVVGSYSVERDAAAMLAQEAAARSATSRDVVAKIQQLLAQTDAAAQQLITQADTAAQQRESAVVARLQTKYTELSGKHKRIEDAFRHATAQNEALVTDVSAAAVVV